MNNEIKKVRREDLEIKKGTIEVDCVLIDGKPINLTQVSYQSIETFITHDNCVKCGNEFKKEYSFNNKCSMCKFADELERYEKLALIEWDGETPLCIFNDDKYFFSVDDIQEYIDEQEDLNIEDLMLCVCEESSFLQIDYQHFADVVHDEWEPSDEMKRKLEEFNDFLRAESTNTWFQGKQRVTLKKEVLNG